MTAAAAAAAAAVDDVAVDGSSLWLTVQKYRYHVVAAVANAAASDVDH